MLTIKFNNSTIKVMSNDLQSQKNLIAKNVEIVYNNDKSGIYKGKIVKGLPNGYGVKAWTDNKRY